MLKGEHSATLLTLIKLLLVIKIFVLSVFERPFSGVTTYVIAWMLQTRSMSPSLIYKVSFPFVKLYIHVLVPVKTKQCRRCLTSHLNIIYNGHAQKCRCLCNHSPTNIEAGDCWKYPRVSLFNICGWMITKATTFLGVIRICSVQVAMGC